MQGNNTDPDVNSSEVVGDLAVTLNKDCQTNAAAALAPDQSIAEQFFKAIASGLDDIMFEYRTFDANHDRQNRGLLGTLGGTIQKNWSRLVHKSHGGAGCFVVVNKTDGTGLKKNVTEVRAVFADIDGAPLSAILQDEIFPPPHIINETSSGKYHVFWRGRGLPLEQFTPIQKMIARRFNGDPRVCDLSRVMRIPGLIHQKIKNGLIVPPSVSRIFQINEMPTYTATLNHVGGADPQRIGGNGYRPPGSEFSRRFGWMLRDWNS